MAITYTDFQNIALAIAAYAQERWTYEKRINSTGMMGTDQDIDVAGESFVGQMRWYKPIDPTINVPSLTTATDGTYSSISTDMSNYIKTVRALGIKQVNLQNLISQQNGLAYFASNLAEMRAKHEHEAVLSVLKGVAGTEVALGTGILTFGTNGSTGMFVDLNALGEFGAAATSTGTARKLIDSSKTGAARGERLFRALGMAFKDYEPSYMYLVTSPEMLADLRAANLVDETKVTDGNLEFQTIFGGMFRLVLTRADQGNLSASANVNDYSTKTSFLVKPGAIAWKEIPITTPVETDRQPAAYLGGGSNDLWYRFGFVAHPMGYDWAGATNAFPSNATLATAASWDRKADPLNLGILPILHA
jgi:hypothetical protein